MGGRWLFNCSDASNVRLPIAGKFPPFRIGAVDCVTGHGEAAILFVATLSPDCLGDAEQSGGRDREGMTDCRSPGPQLSSKFRQPTEEASAGLEHFPLNVGPFCAVRRWKRHSKKASILETFEEGKSQSGTVRSSAKPRRRTFAHCGGVQPIVCSPTCCQRSVGPP